MRHPSTPDCSIKGCKRAVFKGQLCQKHYGMVPIDMRMRGLMTIMQQTHNAARRQHKYQLAYVRELLAGETP
jgi:hypothetical protein